MKYVNEFPSVTHVALTVSDLDASVTWYRRLFDSEPVLDEDTGPFHHVVFALGGGMLFGLHTFPSPAAGDGRRCGFDEHNVGLDHVAFGCPDRSALQAWSRRLDDWGIKHGDIVDAHYGSGLSFRDPDNIALEFFCLPTPDKPSPPAGPGRDQWH